MAKTYEEIWNDQEFQQEIKDHPFDEEYPERLCRLRVIESKIMEEKENG